MTFTITAELPLGTYHGRAPDGSSETVPSLARLHAALLSAAGYGPRAVPGDDGWIPYDADDAALRWLEDHPPDAVSIPPMRVNTSRAVAYREEGTLAPRKRGTKKLGKQAGRSVAVAGRFAWSWDEDPPAEIADALTSLCPDVSHLGTTESPVRLRTSTDIPETTHRLDREADLFGGAGDDVALPTAGRTAELRAHHTSRRKRPTATADKVTTDENSSAPAPPRATVRSERYAPIAAAAGECPWPRTLVIPLGRRIPDRAKVAWAVAAHRGLIRLIGEGAPGLLTGIYAEGVRRPANRLALQVLDPGLPVAAPGEDVSSLVVMIPRDADAADVAVVLGAVGALDSIRGPRGALLHPRLCRAVPGDRFWRDPAPGAVRLWRTDPVAVPDTRGSGPEWTFVHAALLSLAFVWQGSEALPRVPGRGAARDARLTDAANAAGAAVVENRPVFTSTVQDYVHHVHPDAVVRPYRAVLSLGDLGGPGTVQAIGQSRHLGGGLLVPVDVPEGAVAGDLLGEDR